MSDTEWIRYHTRLSLQRLLPRLRREFSNWVETEEWREFENRLHRQWGRLFDLLVRLYDNHYDFFYYLEQLLLNAARSWLERSASLKILDQARDADPLWYMSQQMVGSYRYLKPSLGTIEELSELAEALQKEGISLVLDFVFNHTSDEHEWARKARAGDLFYQSFYHIFPDRELPDQYEQHLRDIFPELRRGSFIWNAEMERWVWTTCGQDHRYPPYRGYPAFSGAVPVCLAGDPPSIRLKLDKPPGSLRIWEIPQQKQVVCFRF